MNTYPPQGRAHMALSRLALGPASFADLAQAIGATRPKDRTKAFLTLSAMRTDALVRREGPETYAITDAGLAALERLRADEGVTVEAVRPNCRVFRPVAVSA